MNRIERKPAMRNCIFSRVTLYTTLALAAVIGPACDKDPLGNDGFTPREPVTIPVLGHGTITNRFAAEVAVDGQWAYTTTWSARPAPGNAVMVWNVAANTPVLVDTLIVSGANTLGDVQISDDKSLLVVATEYRPGSIVIFDRTTPEHPVQVARFSSENTAAGVHTVKLGRVGNRHLAFLSIDPSPARLVIVDITIPSNPIEIFEREMGSPFVHDVFVRDGLLFTALWDDGISIWDIGGGGRNGVPENPVLISNLVTVNGNVHNIWWFHNPNGEKRYVFVGEEGPGSVTGGASSGDIHVVDISDISQPREVAYYSVQGAGTHNFVMDEASSILYAAYYNGGVRALDMSGDLSKCDSDALVGGRCNMGLAGREAGFALTDGNPRVAIWGVALNGTNLYASDMLSGIYKLNVATLME
jgi:hypothetical protein